MTPANGIPHPASGVAWLMRVALIAIATIVWGASVSANPKAPAAAPVQIAARAKGMAVVVELTNRSPHRLCLLLSYGKDALGLSTSAIDVYYGDEATHSFP